jgi:hypothetical protein
VGGLPERLLDDAESGALHSSCPYASPLATAG